jgi:hypothetical protein
MSHTTNRLGLFTVAAAVIAFSSVALAQSNYSPAPQGVGNDKIMEQGTATEGQQNPTMTPDQNGSGSTSDKD